jgi:hypothetical protein
MNADDSPRAQRAIGPADAARLTNYLRATPIEVGLLLNFGLRPAVRRFVLSNAPKTSVRHQPSSAAA